MRAGPLSKPALAFMSVLRRSRMQRSSRVDYDAIAELYDSTPHREKSADPELIAFLAGYGPAASLTLLDIACGTGNQQIANRGLAPDARFVGLDGSLGMLRQARRKMPDIAWVHGDSAALPFAPGSFDFVSCQYAFHHFRDKAGMLREAFRVLRSVAWHDSSNRTCGFPCIRLSDKTSRLHPRHVAPKPGQTHEPEGLVEVREWIAAALPVSCRPKA